MRRGLWVAAAVLAGATLLVPATSGAWTASVKNADAAGVSLWYSCTAALSAIAPTALFEWNLADAAGSGQAADASGAGITGTYAGTHTTSTSTGPGGCARENPIVASLDGSSSWIGSVKSTIPSGFTTGLTLTGWIRTPAGWGGGGDLLMLCNVAPPATTCAQRDFRLYLTASGAPVFAIASSSATQALIGAGSITDGAWHQVTGTMSSTAGMRLSVDGVDVTGSATPYVNGSAGGSAASFTSTRSVGAGYWHVGSGDGGTNWPSHDPTGTAVVFLKGQVTGVAALGGALSAQQVASLYAAGR